MNKKLTVLLTLLLVFSLISSLYVFAAPTEIKLYGDNFGQGEGPGAPRIENTNTLGTKFTVEAGKALISLKYVAMPTYTSSKTVFTFKLFKWDTDLATTIASTPVYTEVVEEHADNQDRVITFTNAIEAGDYLAYLCDGHEKEGGNGGAAAFWASKPIASVETYWCGELRTDFNANIMITVDDASTQNPSTGDYSFIIPMILVAVVGLSILVFKNRRYIVE